MFDTAKLITGGASVGLGLLTAAGQADFPSWIGQVGFPIAVTAFVLLRVEERMREQTKQIARLARAVEADKGLQPPLSDDGEDDPRNTQT